MLSLSLDLEILHSFPTYLITLKSQLQLISIIKDIGIYYSSTISFNYHIDVITSHALKILGFIKRNTKLFSSLNCLRSLYFALVWSIFEYGVIVWHPHLAKDQLRIERVQYTFFCMLILFLNYILRIITIPI